MSLIEPTTISRLAGRYIGSPEEVVPAGSRREARDGSVLWWGKADTPGPPQVVSAGLPTRITVAVSPVRPGHTVAVEYRSNGGPVCQTIALPVPGAHHAPARLFRALLPLAAKRASGLPTGPPLRRTADFAPPHRVRETRVAQPRPVSRLRQGGYQGDADRSDVYVVSVGGRKHAG